MANWTQICLLDETLNIVLYVRAFILHFVLIALAPITDDFGK